MEQNGTVTDSQSVWLEPVSLMLGLTFLVAFGELAILHFRYGTLRTGIVWQTIVWYLLAAALFGGALWWYERHPRFYNSAWIWGIGIGARLILLLTTPTLSDDVYRYLWDGYIANQGVSPYALPIDAPELDQYEIPLRFQANHRWMASPYMPAAQIVFRTVTALFPLTPLTMQVTMLFFDLVTAALLTLLLRQSGLPARRLLLYLWNPLIIVEVAHSAHVDAWMVLLMMLAIFFTYTRFTDTPTESVRREMLPPLLLSLATLTKLLPILIFPILFWRWNRLQRITYGLFSLLLLLPAGLGAGWGLFGPLNGRGLFGALRIYNDQWNFNSGLFYWLVEGIEAAGRTPDQAQFIGRLSIGIGMLILLLIVWLLAAPPSFKARLWPWSNGVVAAEPIDQPLRLRADLRLMIIPFIGYILLTHTVHPWYLLILIPFLLFLAPAQAESRVGWWFVVPWLYLSGALILSYLTYINPNDLREFEWVRLTEWVPTLALLVVGVYFWTIMRVTGERPPATSDR